MRLSGDFKFRAGKHTNQIKRYGALIAGISAMLAVNGTSFASADQIVEQTLTADAPVATYQMPTAYAPQHGGMR